MPPTLIKTSLRYLAKHPWQLLLAILGVALGVAVVVAIDLANASARRAFAISSETVAGRATHQIVGGPAGLAEDVYRRLRTDLGVRDAAPIVDGYALAPALPGLTLQVLGIDPVAEGPFRPYLSGTTTTQGGAPGAFFVTPGAALLSSETAGRYGLTAGAPVTLQIGSRSVEARLLGLLEPADERSRRALDGLLVVDIATAQEWFGRVGRLSRIDLLLPDGAAGEAELARIQTILPPGARIETPALRGNAIQQMTAAFELNLTALSLLALVVGMFLIYNTITFSVVQRRALLGMLRCIGVTRGQIFALVIGEALLLGVVGALLGVVLGVALGRGLVGLVTQTINDLYFSVTVRAVEIGWLPIVKGLVLGVGATLVAALVPAAEATFTPPRLVLRRSSFEDRARQFAPIAAGVGVLLLLAGLAMLALPGGSLVLGFGALLAMTLGAAALVPATTLVLMAVLRPVLGRVGGTLGRMAARDVSAALSRTAVAIAALMIAISVTIGVGLMVGSFRDTLIGWLEVTLRADVFVSAPSASAGRLDAPIPPAVVDLLANAPGVERARRYRSATVASSVGPVLALAVEVDAPDQQGFRFVAGDPAQAWPAFAASDVLVSEPLAFRHGLVVGQQITLTTDRGERSFRIAGVYYDYGSDQGVVMLPLARYRELYDDPVISSMGLYVAPGQDPEAQVQALRALVPAGEVVLIRSNRTLREASIAIFDRTFAITSVLQLLATVVAFIGILAALTALQLERARELAMLRALGLTPGQLWRLVVSQTALMGLTAGALAIPTGVMMAAVLVFFINKRSFGWTLFFRLDPGLFAQAVATALVAAVLAGLYPAWRMARTSPALALRDE